MMSVVMVRDPELRRSDRNLERSTDDHLKQEEESNNETRNDLKEWKMKKFGG